MKGETDEADTASPAREVARPKAAAAELIAAANRIDGGHGRTGRVVAGRCCIVCGADRRIDPAHLIPRSLGGCGDALCVVPLCRTCHRAYDRGELDLLPYLEPGWRAQLAHAVGHVGLIGALRRISGSRREPTTGRLP